MANRFHAVFLATGLIISEPASAAELCHVANAGFLIKGESVSVLLDGLMEEDQYEGRFALPSEQMLADMMNKTGLFSDLALVLSTHRHGDHFDPKATLQHMRATEGVRYGVPAGAVATLEANGLRDAERERLFVVEDGPQGAFNFKQIQVDTFDVDHGPNMPQNVGYRVTVDGVSFFHTGDISATRAQLSEAGLDNLDVDALIIPFWYGFQNAEQRASMESSWNFKTIVPTHFSPTPAPWMEQFGGLDGVKKNVADGFERAVINTEEGKCTPIN